MPRINKSDKKSSFEKRYGLPKSCRKIKFNRNIKTVNDLLTRCDVNDIIENLADNKKDITDIIAIYKTSDGGICYSYAIEAKDKRDQDLKAIRLIDFAKDMILHPTNGSEDEDDTFNFQPDNK